METSIIVSIVVDIAVAAAIYIFLKRDFDRRKSVQEGEAREKADLILKEVEINAEGLKKNKAMEAKEHFLKLKSEFEEDTLKRRQQHAETENKLKQKDQHFNQLQEKLNRKEAELDSMRENVSAQQQQIAKRKEDIEKLHQTQVQKLEKIANLTASEAREQIIETLRNEAESKASAYVKDIVEEAKLTATKEARKVVIETIQRTATEHAIENCVSVFNIESDEIKGKIIGKL
jgi:ribonuclease Y